MTSRNLKGLNLSDLQTFAESLGEKKYRGTQLYQWLYAKQASSFDEMSDISREFREILKRSATIDNLQIVTAQASPIDGTQKFLFRLQDGIAIESVLIPPDKLSPDAERRLTLCVSTQVGCPLDCAFCATGAMGFTRNLTAGEIIDQVIQAQRLSTKRITNLVYMGMGEPMLNYDNVMASVEIINDNRSLNIGVRHITISTAGYADKIRRMADEGRRVKLALSLHSLDNEKRTRLMPINRKFPLEALMDALAYYYTRTRLRPTFEYIPFAGFNDGQEDVLRFIQLSRRFPCKVNLIPFHSIEFMHPSGFASTLRPTPPDRMEWFAEELRKADINVMTRSSAGQDIEAACGQLAVHHQHTNGNEMPPGTHAVRTADQGAAPSVPFSS
jgi:23S rRNA (adenine2503-C2)-methyltransferase